MTSKLERDPSSRYIHVRSLSFGSLNFLESQFNVMDLDYQDKLNRTLLVPPSNNIVYKIYFIIECAFCNM